MRKLLLSATIGTLAFSASAQQKHPLFEVFTSSTCPPCNPGNANLKNILSNHADSEYVVIKYQQNFPGTGDPYCTTEGVNRRAYYAVNSIPRMEINGGWDGNAQSFTEALYTSSKTGTPQYSIAGTYNISGKVVTVNVNYNVLTTVSAGSVLYVAITEKNTVQNVKTNGETQFENVMKKMLPTETGTAITEITAGQSGTKTLSFTFAGDYRLPPNGSTANRINDATENSVEDFSNLEVIVWIQGADKKVYEAYNLKRQTTGLNNISTAISNIKLFPNPAREVLNLSIAMKTADKVNVNLYDMRGAIVASASGILSIGNGTISLNTAHLASGNYTCVVTDSKNNSNTQIVSIAH